MQWRHRVLRLGHDNGGHRLCVVALVGWRWLVSSIVHDVCHLFGHPCTYWAPAHKLSHRAFVFAETGSQVLVSVPISTAEARRIFPDSDVDNSD